MNELRVAIFTGSYNHIIDGVTLSLNRLVRFLKDRGIPVKVFSSTVKNPALKTHNDELVSVPSVPIPGRSEYRLAVGFPVQAQKKLKEFDPTLIHIATPDYLGFSAIRFAQANDIPLVASYHTNFTSYLKYYNLDFLKPLGWKYISWFYNQCEHIYVPTTDMVSELCQHGIQNGLRLWARGVDTERFNPNKRDLTWRRKLNFADDDVVVTFVSRLVWEKNLHVYAKVLTNLKQNHKNIKSLVVGDGPVRKDLEAMLPGSKFVGFMTGEELARAYASSDIFFFPSDTETFGNVTLEAMASGLPAVVADAPGSKSLVERGLNGYLAHPQDSDEFSRLILKLVQDAGLRKQMAEVARKKAVNNYHWDTINQGLLQNYFEVANIPQNSLEALDMINTEIAIPE